MALPYEFKPEKIYSEGRTNPENVKVIKTWLGTTKLPDLQDETIVLFLVSCENDFGATQNAIKEYFKIKTRAPELFDRRDIDSESLEIAREVLTSCSLPKRINNTVIHLYKVIDADYRKFVMPDIFKIGLMAMDVSQRRDPPNGLIVVLDVEGLHFMHLTCIKISAIKNLVDYVQDGMPLKIKKIHVLNANYVAEKILSIARLFMKPQLAAAMEIHPLGYKMSDFHQKWIPAEFLPVEYGGDLPGVMELKDKAIAEFREMKPFFDAQEKLVHSYEFSK